ncbi:uncharacterized protein LOC124543371 [Vanessa cardui]|uniref:uncharacterized protein LOC124543371 n=1 Tax=Vanessa cardui TaxID=171605 RepID=UPI001F135C0E|nr:uncharacterized protein LOC124543371 [Vanessa cardui]
MVRILAKCDDNVSEACHQYAIKFPNVPTPSRVTMLAATQRLRDYGQFRSPLRDSGRPPRRTVREEEDILEFFEANPAASTNDAARRFNVSQYFAWSVVHNEGKYPFHLLRVQELNEPDKPARVAFCNWVLNERPTILWTDEATFDRVGLFNSRNEHLWCHDNPHKTRPHHFQHRFSVNVWAGIVNSTLLGPVFLERLNGETYQRFLTETLPDLEEDIPLADLRVMYYQHDGAPAHNAREFRNFLNNNFPGRWIGRGGPRAWPARSPDITPLDFYLWGHVKTLVYSGREITSREMLVEKITWAFDQIKSNSQVLSRVNEQLIFRCGLCVGCEGDYIEQYVRDTHRHPRDLTLRGTIE